MKVTRIYTGTDGQSHFEDLDIPQPPGRYGSFSELIPGPGVMFVTVPAGFSHDFQPTHQRSFIITLSGMVESEVAGGETRRIGPGERFLADDTLGHGHITRVIDGPWEALYATVSEEVDVAAWRPMASSSNSGEA